MSKPKNYHAERHHNGTEDQIDIMSPQGKAIAFIQYWDERDTDHAAQAETNATLIIAALNAFTAKARPQRKALKPTPSRPVLKGPAQ